MRPRVLALDLGEKRIGVAISDELRITAQGLPNIEENSRKDSLARIMALASEYNIERIVIGLPKNMDGSLGFKSQEVVQFSEQLRQLTEIPVTLWDERLTTKMAEQAMLEADLSRRKRKKKIDMVAAQLILQSYLDSPRNAGRKENE